MSFPNPVKRAQEKIKDFVEAKAFDLVENYANDLRHALAAYLFTAGTSELLARWLDALAESSRGQGAALALAGLRGVGKSHLLAAFGALAAYPDLRATINEAHVAHSARRLLNRRYQVVFVERGTRPTLMEEFSAALAQALQVDEAQWAGQKLGAVVAIAASRSELPLVFIVDTAAGREARVRRDDGPLLAELAEAAKTLNIFAGLALDDDISGADGVNVALAGSYRIDYLDPEHLYRITDVHLFQKNDQTRVALHDIYVHLRNIVPGFNWSEPRFMALYPVHPLIADVASAVRLYAQNFAFLPFAATAGGRAINRPALSLVVLDDVFDRSEYDLRKAEELQGAFAAYDELATEAIAQIPIMQRLQAKLVLKGLFILSLDGRGTTARELCAAMLLYDEGESGAAPARVEELLLRFAAAAPPKSFVVTEESEENRYRFHIAGAAGFEEALAESLVSLEVDNQALAGLWQSLARRRFSDWPLFEEPARSQAQADLLIHWRGLGRHVLLSWRVPDEAGRLAATPKTGDPQAWPFDWEVALLAPDYANSTREIVTSQDSEADTLAIWRPSAPLAEELDTLRRLLALRTDAKLLSSFGEAARAAERTHAALAERIWTRLFLDQGALLMGWAEFPFTDEAKSAKTLNQCLGGMLAPLLGARYPQHPVFFNDLGESEVSQLVGGLVGGSSVNDNEVQRLARLFAAPLGLAALRGAEYVLETSDQALKQPWIREVMALTDAADGQVVPFETVYQKLRGEPYGLLRRVQRLVLAALVAQRRIDLITSTGDRIGRRTLDLRIRWDDIAGIARVESLLYTADELTAWARMLTGAPKMATINTPEARQEMRTALAAWLENWRAQALLEKFEALPEEALTTRIWNLGVAARKSFQMAAEAVEETLADNVTLEEGLQRVADAFANSPQAHARYASQHAQLAAFVNEWPFFAATRAYLWQAEPLADPEMSAWGAELLAFTADVNNLFETELVARCRQLWPDFHARYCDFYARVHEKTVGAAQYLHKIEELLHSDEWRIFAAFARLPLVSNSHWQEAQDFLEKLPRVPCRLPVRETLMSAPACACGFRVTEAAWLNQSPATLRGLMRNGLEAYHRTVAAWNRPLTYALDDLITADPDGPLSDQARALFDELLLGDGPPDLTYADLQLLEQVLQKGNAPPLRVLWPTDTNGLMSREELAARLKQWLDELPNYPAMLDVDNK